MACNNYYSFGISIEAWEAIHFWTPGETRFEAVSKLTADLLIGIGLAIEAICILRAIVENRKEKRESDEKIADANERASKAEQKAAEARERTADIERLTAWRHVLPEWKRDLSDAMQDMAPSLDVLIEFEAGDTEAFGFAREIAKFFSSCGIEKIRGGANSYPNLPVFGLFIAVAPEVDAAVIIEALVKAGMHPQVLNRDLSTHLPRGVPAPNLYIFVAPKPSPSLIDTEASAAGGEPSP